MATTWSNDVKLRLAALAALAATSGTKPDTDHFVWHDGRYVVLHFDLMTIKKSGLDVDRGPVYAVVEKIAKAQGGMHMGGSVYAVPLAAGEASMARAIALWNAIAAATDKHLVEGDAFFLHYSLDTKNQMGGIAQVIPPKQTRLHQVNSPPPKAAP